MSRPDIVISPSRSLSASPKGMAAFLPFVGIAALVVSLSAKPAHAQSPHLGHQLQGGSTTIYGQPGSPIPISPPPTAATDISPSPVPHGGGMAEETMLIWHVLFDQLEGRMNGSDTELRWDGEGWVGTDYNRLWFKSEGFVNEQGRVEDGIQEVLYDRPISFLRYFDWQAGLRYDWDSSPGRLWGALGIEGLAPGFFDVEATLYVRDAGHFAGRVNGSYDLLLTNRLIAQPELELNFYSKKDPVRAVGTGLAEIDTGLRLRYEFSRKFAPYIGVVYDGKFGDTATFVRHEGGVANDVRFIFGIRVWY
jgi:copper resistance protein B